MWPFKNPPEKPEKNQKLVEKAAEQPRISGKFAAPPSVEAARATGQVLENEVKQFTTLATGMKELELMAAARQKAIQDAAEAMLGPFEDEGGSVSWLGELLKGPIGAALAEHIIPKVGAYVPALLEKYAGVQAAPAQINAVIPPTSPPEATPNTPAPENPLTNFKTLMEKAATTSPVLLKASMPVINSELEKRGLDKEVFKQAIRNLNKVV